MLFLISIYSYYFLQACRKDRLRMSPRTITNLMMINLNLERIEKYKSVNGISKKYTGDIKKLVDIRFPDELDVQTEPPAYRYEDLDIGIGFNVADEIYSDSEPDTSGSEGEESDSEEEEEEDEED